MALIDTKNLMSREEANKNDFEEYPAGDYHCFLTEATDWSSANGSGVLFKWQVVDGELQGKVISDLIFTSHNQSWLVKNSNKRLYDLYDIHGKVVGDTAEFGNMEVILHRKASKPWKNKETGKFETKINNEGYSEVKDVKKPSTSFPSTATGSISDDVEEPWEE